MIRSESTQILNINEPRMVCRNIQVGRGTTIWEYVNLYECKIGEDCKIGSFVEIQDGVEIADRVIISSHSFICSLVIIEENVFIGHGVVTINDVYPPSFRRTGSKDGWESTLIQKGAVIGSNATLFPVTIGEGAVVGAGAVVREDVPAGTVAAGNPARIIRTRNK